MNDLEIKPQDIPLRILIVEDDPMAGDILEAILKTTSHTYLLSKTAEEAIERLNKDANFDVILLDYHLPKKSGKEFLEIIRTSETQKKNPHLWVVVHTAEQRVDQIEALLNAGANDYLPKPIFPHLIIIKLLTGQYNIARSRALRRRVDILERMLAEESAKTQTEKRLDKGEENKERVTTTLI